MYIPKRIVQSLVGSFIGGGVGVFTLDVPMGLIAGFLGGGLLGFIVALIMERLSKKPVVFVEFPSESDTLGDGPDVNEYW